MPCLHKFYNDLNLQYVDWEVRTLFIGTFNPGWQSLRNTAEWFYGRTQRNAFWCILQNLHGGQLPDQNRSGWIDFCRTHHLGITDVIQELSTAQEENLAHVKAVQSFKDDDLVALSPVPTDIPAILEQHPAIRQICITRLTFPPFWQQQFAPMYHWIAQHPERNIQVLPLRSPSRGARRGVVGDFCQFVAGRWLDLGYQVL